MLLRLCSSSAGEHALLLCVSCSALLVASVPALQIGPKLALLLGFSLVVMRDAIFFWSKNVALANLLLQYKVVGEHAYASRELEQQLSPSDELDPTR